MLAHPDTVVGPDATVLWPQYCEKFDFELELGMVIGRRGKNIRKDKAGRYIAGYTIWNDYSARDQQMKEGPLGMGPSKGKDFDTGNAVGPYLVTADELKEMNDSITAVLDRYVGRLTEPGQRPPGSRLCEFVAWGIPTYFPGVEPV
jgi:2-keto-4-pentenoate hydratase/2-oxohepta-3-ene-1,7-dioic acid hydratase in catechol pathway